ncbi:MAG: hypothetical protein ACR2QT_08280 [Woeseiaceae bacterium]
MGRSAGVFVAVLLSLAIGYFAGREHLKYEMRTALTSAAEEFSAGLTNAFGGTSEVDSEKSERKTKTTASETDPDTAAYIANGLELYEVSSGLKKTYSGTVPGVNFKIKNVGDRSLDRVEVTVYFKDANGNTIAEEDYHPVLVSEYSRSGNNTPLKPGYIWQMENNKFYTAKQVPSEWKEGSINAAITEIRFSK